jgi:hypothetical protein
LDARLLCTDISVTRKHFHDFAVRFIVCHDICGVKIAVERKVIDLSSYPKSVFKGHDVGISAEQKKMYTKVGFHAWLLPGDPALNY